MRNKFEFIFIYGLCSNFASDKNVLADQFENDKWAELPGKLKACYPYTEDDGGCEVTMF